MNFGRLLLNQPAGGLKKTAEGSTELSTCTAKCKKTEDNKAGTDIKNPNL
jgi:hypothetical protein